MKKMIDSKYTFVFEENIEKQLDEVLAAIAREIGEFAQAKYVEFLVLGGGYGRGEGGVLLSENSAPRLYNDLDFFVISNTKNCEINSKIDAFFAKISQKYEKILGIDVDFSKATEISYIQKRLNVLMWREMVLGANIVWGDPQKFREIFKVEQAKTPAPKEVQKLLFNRLSGLFFARQKLKNENLSEADFDFISRNINKAILALADANLVAANNYPFKSLARLEALKKILKSDDDLLSAYQKALDFKRFPKPFCDKTSAIEAWQKAANIALQTLSNLSNFLNKNEICPKEILKSAVKTLKNRKLFADLKHRANPLKNPIQQATQILAKMLKNPDEVTEAQFKTYEELWKRLN